MNSVRQPLVTVFSLCYNTGRYVVEALECVRKQTFNNIEHIIIDDCSTDDSVSCISNWILQKKYKCTFIKNEKNIGIPAVFNKALKMANGKYITWISDDLWENNRLEKTISLFESMPDDVDIMFGIMKTINSEGNPIGENNPVISLSLSNPLQAKKIFSAKENATIISGQLVRNALFSKCFIPAPTVTVRKTLYEKIGDYDESLFIEDLDCWFRASAKSSFVYVPEILVSYRIHDSNYTSGISENYIKSLIKILNRYLPKENKLLKSSIKNHIREESFRIGNKLASSQKTSLAVHYFFNYYLPNINASKVCLKEVVIFTKAVLKSFFSK